MARAGRGTSLGRRTAVVLAWALLGTLGFGIVSLALGILLGPSLAAPTSTFSMMTDPTRLSRLEDRVEKLGEELSKAPGATASLVVEAADLNAMLARALGGDSGEGFRAERARVVLTPERLRLEAAFMLGGRGVPAYLRDRTVGLVVRVAPRVDNGTLALGVVGAQLGRVPLPVGLLLRFAGPRAPLPPEIVVDAGARTVRIALPNLAPPEAEGVRLRLVGLAVEEGRLILEFRLDEEP